MSTSDRNDDQADPRDADDIHLPNAKEVNKQLRKERKAAKASRPRPDAGKFKYVVEAALRKRPNNPVGQFQYYLDKTDIPAATGSRRTISEKRQTNVGDVLLSIPRILKSLNMHIQNITDIRRKHVVALVRFWTEGNKKPGTIADRVSILRRFLELSGKPEACPRGEAWAAVLLLAGVEVPRRSAIPEVAKGWRDLGIDPMPIIERVSLESPVCGCHLKIELAFGLRGKEGVQFQPKLCDKGDYIVLTRGTKNGKIRQVPFSHDPLKRAWQRAVLDEAIELASKNPRGELGERRDRNDPSSPWLNLKQMMRRQRYVFEKHGITKKGLGVVPHGLRHQFASELFHDLTDMDAPVLGRLPAEEYKRSEAKVKAAYFEVGQQLGHERGWITVAYDGSPGKVMRDQDARLRGWLTQLGACKAALDAAGASDCWIMGRAAQGVALLEREAMQIFVRLSDQTAPLGTVMNRLQTLSAAVEKVLGVKVLVAPWAGAGTPPDAAEVTEHDLMNMPVKRRGKREEDAA